MTVEETNRLIEKYLEGLTSPEEEQRLALEVSGADVPQEWLIIRDMLGELTVGEAIYDKVVKGRRRRRWLSYGGWGIAASLALLFAWSGLMPKEQTAEIAGELVEANIVAEVAPADERETKPEVEAETVVEIEKAVEKRSGKKVRPTVVEPAPTLARAMEEEPPVEVVEEPERAVFSIEELKAQVTETDLAQVERKFELWKLRQTILNESIELEIAAKELERKYKAYLAENTVEI